MGGVPGVVLEEVRGKRRGKVAVAKVGEEAGKVLCKVKDKLKIDSGSNVKKEWS